MCHASRLASILAACLIPLTTAAAADSLDLDERLRAELGVRQEAKLSERLQAQLDAQTGSLLAREQARLDGLVEARLSEQLEAKLDSKSAELVARNHRPAEIVVIADSAGLTTTMTCAVSDSRALACVAAPVCADPEIELASAATPISPMGC